MPTFSDGESKATVRAKINNAITRTDWCVLVKDVSELENLVYTTGSQWTVAAGDNVVTAKEGFHYAVLASDASSFDIQPGAVKMDVLPTAAGHYNFDAMLPAGDGVTDDWAKLDKLIKKPTTTGHIAIYIPNKVYYQSDTHELKRPVTIFGDADGFYSPFTGTLKFAPDVMGFTVNRFNTINGDVESPTTTGADNSTFRGIRLQGGGGTDRTKHGIWLRARAAIISCFIDQFPGNGINIVAGAGVGGAAEGNANLWLVQNTRCQQNRNWGMYVDGADTNAGNGIAVDCSSNGRGGIWDSSFLGNTYYGCHVATNGVATTGGNSSIQSAYVSYENNQYAAHWAATEAELVSTVPGTDPTVWILDFPGGGVKSTVPLWTPGRPEGTYFRAFAYFSDGSSSRNVFINCYSEGGQPGSVMLGNSAFYAGLLHLVYSGGILTSEGGGTLWRATTLQAASEMVVGDSGSPGTLTFNNDGTSLPWRFQPVGNDMQMRNGNAGARVAYTITGDSATVPWKFSVGDFLLGGKRMMMGTAAPTTGTYAVGDRVLNSAPAVGSPKGWICTVAGTPGTWVSEGNL